MDAQEIKQLQELQNAYLSVYEAKKVDQDEDGDNDFADVIIARMIASGVSKEEAIRKVKNKEYNEEFEIDEATRMRRELGKEGEIAIRKELARRSARSAGTLTPAEKKKLGEQYNLVLSYLLDEGYASNQESAEVIIENMSESWIESIVESLI